MKRVALLLFSSVCFFANGQQWEWAYPITSNGGSWIMNVHADPSKNPVFVGWCNPFSSTFSGHNGAIASTNLKSFVAKYDRKGNIAWVGGGSQGSYVESSGVDKYGNIYISGEYNDTAYFGMGNDTLQTFSSTSDYFLAKLDTTGRAVFLNSGGGPCYDEGTSITTYPSDELVHFWFDKTTCNGNNYVTKYIEKLDLSGSLLWSLPLTAAFYYINISPQEVTPTTDNGFLLSDYWFWDHSDICFPGLTDTLCFSPPGPEGETDVFLVKYSLNGDPIWGKAIRGKDYQFERNITVDSSNNILLAIESLDTSYYESVTLLPKGDRTLHLIKADSNGNLIKYLSFASSIFPTDFWITDLKSDSKGNVYIMAKTDSVVEIGADTVHFNLPPNRVATAIIKLDPDLKYLWSQYVISGVNDGGVMYVDDSMVYVGIHHDYSVVLHGSNYQFSAPSTPNSDSFMAAIRNTPSLVGVSEYSDRTFDIFPNPTSGIFSILMDRSTVEPVVIIGDVLGNKLLEEKPIVKTSPQLNLSSWPKGIYFVELVLDQNRIVRKIVIQ